MNRMNTSIQTIRLLMAAILIVLGLALLPTTGLCNEDLQQFGRRAVILTAANVPPYAFEFPKDGKRGLLIEIVDAAFLKAGIDPVFKFYPSARSLAMIIDGNAAGGSMMMDPDKWNKTLVMSAPYATAYAGFIVKRSYSGPPPTTLSDLRGLNAGTHVEYITSKLLTEMAIPHDLSHSSEVVVRKVADGRLDVAVLGLRNARYTIKELNRSKQLKVFPGSKPYPIHVGFSREWPGVEELVKAFNKGLQAIKNDGTYDAIQARYK